MSRPENRARKCLLITTVWPEWTSSAAGVRTRYLAEVFQKAGYRVTLQCSAVDSRFRSELEALGFETHAQPINDDSFDTWIKEYAPDVVIFDRFVIEEQFGWRVKQHSPTTLLVLDTQDLHFLRRHRGAELQSSPTQWSQITERSEKLKALQQSDWTSNADALRELGAIQRCDLSLVVSDFERDLLLQSPFSIPPTKILLCRWGVAPLPETETPNWETREGLSLIGNFRHPPNHDGVFWFHREIWPILQAQSSRRIRVHLYGAYAPREISELHSPETGFLFHGWAPDETLALQRAQLNLAPLRFGAGIKGKILEGWRAGTPCIATSIGAEGLCESDDFGGKIANSSEEFANAILSFTEDVQGSRFREAAQQGRDILARHYSPDSIASELLNRVEDLLQDLSEIRRSDFWGAVLSQELCARTKYFSQWIEAKNKAKSS